MLNNESLRPLLISTRHITHIVESWYTHDCVTVHMSALCHTYHMLVSEGEREDREERKKGNEEAQEE